MSKKILIAGLSLFCLNLFLTLFFSCNPDPFGGDEDHCKTLSCFNADSLHLKLYNKGYPEEMQVPYYAVKATDLEFQLHFTTSVVTCYNKPAGQRRNLSLFNSAYAYSPAPCRILLGKDSIAGYNVYSDKDYDANHPAGSSLNDIITSADLFDASIKYYGGQGAPIPAYKFSVNAVPADTGRHVFTFQLTQKDGDIINLSMASIKLLK